jgi:hypothetical protein
VFLSDSIGECCRVLLCCWSPGCVWFVKVTSRREVVCEAYVGRINLVGRGRCGS